MRYRAVTLTLLVLTLCQLPAARFCAASQDAGRFLQELRRQAAEVRAFACDFSQEKNLAMFQKPIVFSGRLTVNRPAQLRWEFLAPIPSVLLLNGDRGRRCEQGAPPKDFLLATDPVMAGVAEQIWLWLGGGFAGIEESYQLSLEENDRLLVVPKDENARKFLTSVRVSFAATGTWPSEVLLTENGGDTTLLQFSACQAISTVADQLFNQCQPND